MLTPIAFKDIAPVWDKVRAGLVTVKQHTTDDWLPEDVYCLLKNGNATLYLGMENGDYLGFLVLRLVPTFHGSKVDVWCAYSASNTPILLRAWPEVQAIARNAGAGRVAFSSAREEWRAVSERLGFTPKQTTYEFTPQEQP